MVSPHTAAPAQHQKRNITPSPPAKTRTAALWHTRVWYGHRSSFDQLSDPAGNADQGQDAGTHGNAAKTDRFSLPPTQLSKWWWMGDILKYAFRGQLEIGHLNDDRHVHRLDDAHRIKISGISEQSHAQTRLPRNRGNRIPHEHLPDASCKSGRRRGTHRTAGSRARSSFSGHRRGGEEYHHRMVTRLHRPSTPSVRFTALTQPTTTNMAKKI